MFDMINIFETFLPQLLRYPNAQDPLNGEAAALLMREPKSYEIKVKGPVNLVSLHPSSIVPYPAPRFSKTRTSFCTLNKHDQSRTTGL